MPESNIEHSFHPNSSKKNHENELRYHRFFFAMTAQIVHSAYVSYGEMWKDGSFFKELNL